VTGSPHQQLSTKLDGDWIATHATESSRRTVADLTLDDSDWHPIEVPGHWRNVAEFTHSDAVLYRHRFEFATEKVGSDAHQKRLWLSVDGLCYQGDIWLDGAYLGDTEGYFIQHVFDVTKQLETRPEHLLAIEATCAQPSDRTAKRNITGVLQDSEFIHPEVNPGGIWRSVRIERTGPVRIQQLRVLVLEAAADRAIIRLTADLDCIGTHSATVRTLMGAAGDLDEAEPAASHEQEHVLASGRNTLEWHLAIEKPNLWWPRALGDQPLYDLTLDVLLDGEVSHRRKRRIGLRQVEMHNWITSINGERLFLKGANLGPPSIDLATTTADQHRLDLDLAAEAGLDVVRVHGHIGAPDFYREADRMGMLIWQDFPLQWGHARGIRHQAVRQARAMVDQLGHHASIILWSAHNEPPSVKPRQPLEMSSPSRFWRTGLGTQQLPSWNRTVLDRSVRKALEASDPSRPAVAHSGVPPHPPLFDGTDSHLYFGWRHGTVSDLATLGRRMPRMTRFVSEFGAQAIPDDAGLSGDVRAEDWPDIDWATLANRHGAQLELLERSSPPDAHPSWSAWTGATQAHQAATIRRTIEILRRLKYRPTGGFCQFLLADAMAYVSCAVLDHTRRPKAGWKALVEASKPVIVVADLLDPVISRGTHRTTIHVISDLREPINEVETQIEWTTAATTQHWNFTGVLPADSVERIARLRLVADHIGPATLRLSVKSATMSSTNFYKIQVI